MVDVEATLRSSLDGRYAIEGEVGRGGMSVVYRARDLKHNRTVAIKVLKPELSEQIGADRFHQEVEFAANLSNPHILPLFDSGEANGNLYYVMPCIEDGSLRDRIDRDGPMDVDEALEIARDVASALGAAHKQDIVHRDIKPANILFSGGEAVVADFGIARATEVEERDRLTQSGLSVGSPAYMSPEQAGGDPVDGRSDIYSLGCVLYTMLTGDPPFVRDTAQAMIAAQLAAAPPSVRNSRPDVPKGVDEIIITALQKRPDDRFASAQEFIEALEHPEEMPERAKERRRRQRIRAVSTTAAIAVGVIGVSWLAWQAFVPEPLPAADMNRVMVFPLEERGVVEPGAGYDAALTIENVLIYADPLTFVDGRKWLDVDQRADASLVTAEVARSTALGQRARWYVTGTILGTTDSATVTLFLHDAVADTSAGRQLGSGIAGWSGVMDAGLDATTRLLPALLEPGREIDPDVIAAAMSSSPVAMLEWIEGDKAYRASRFEAALEHYRAALEADSTWAFAAMKGAQAASWVKETDLALELVERALEDAEALPSRYATFARGLRGYLTADPDLAIEQFEAAVALDSAWAEPLTALGEVYYHLLPVWENPDATAEAYFEKSWTVDSSFVVPLYHLTQMALREGDGRRATRLAGFYREADPEASMAIPLDLALQCVMEGPGSVEWDSLVAADASIVAEVGLNLIEGLRELECSEAALSAILADSTADAGWRRAASSALFLSWPATGRSGDAMALLDSTVAAGEDGNMGYFPLLAVAGYTEFEARGAEVIDLLANVEAANASELWFLGWWSYHDGNIEMLRLVVDRAQAAGESSSNPKYSRLAAGLAAQLAVAEGDTTEAIALLESHPPRARSMLDLEWDWDVALPFGRMLLADLLVANGEFERAIAVAEGFESRPKLYLSFIPRSLEIRVEAAEAMRDAVRAAAYENRLGSLYKQ